jgi:hypothetical protein
VLYHGPVRVPSDARPGKAILRFELPESSGLTSTPTDIPVTLVER